MVELLTRYKSQLPTCVIHCFTGTKEQAITYLSLGCYIGLTGYLWKDKSEDGVRKILQDNVIPLDRLLVETDAPFMYPNTRASKLPQHVKDAMTERYLKWSILNKTSSMTSILMPLMIFISLILIILNSKTLFDNDKTSIPTIHSRSSMFLQRYCTFQRNEPCSLPVTIEMIAAYLGKTPEEIALATTFNALKVFGLSAWTTWRNQLLFICDHTFLFFFCIFSFEKIRVTFPNKLTRLDSFTLGYFRCLHYYHQLHCH